MKIAKRLFVLLMTLLLCAGYASAEAYVTVSELRRQAANNWDKGEVIIPAVDKVPVLTLQAGSQSQDNPLMLTVGTFDESQSGKFVKSVRYGKTPSHVALTNGLTLEKAQTILNDELNRLAGKGIDDYGLIWTEIAEWQNMETWLLYYGQKFFGLTSFGPNTSLTIDIRTEDYHHLILPYYEEKEIIYEDVPLAAWPVIKDAVETYLGSHKSASSETLELGYMVWKNDSEEWLVPVWHLGLTTPDGFQEVNFSAQTGEEVEWIGDKYLFPELFGWETAQKKTN